MPLLLQWMKRRRREEEGKGKLFALQLTITMRDEWKLKLLTIRRRRQRLSSSLTLNKYKTAGGNRTAVRGIIFQLTVNSICLLRLGSSLHYKYWNCFHCCGKSFETFSLTRSGGVGVLGLVGVITLILAYLKLLSLWEINSNWVLEVSVCTLWKLRINSEYASNKRLVHIEAEN